MEGEQMMDQQTISATFPYKSKFVKVFDSRMHYIDEGKGDPIVFLHGIPTSSYLWRNIIPALSDKARCIAPDLIGMGKSDKPDIEYRIFDHIRYIDAFIEALKLDNITFVLHGWGSVIGFDYAMRHPKKVKGIAFYESHVRPNIGLDMLSLPMQHLANLSGNKKASHKAIVENNYFIKKLLPRSVLRELSQEEIAHYQEPFQQPQDRIPLWQYVQDLPLGKTSGDVFKFISKYSEKLQKSTVPKLMLYAVPGFFTTISTVAWCRDNFAHLTTVDVGEALHFAQETEPQKFSKALRDWYEKL